MKTILLFFLLFNFAFASADITGRITDKKTQQPLAGVNVVVENTSTGAATDQDGYFRIQNLKPGSYNLRFYYLGYQTILKSNIVLTPHRSTSLQIEMTEEVLEGETIEVSGSYFEKPKEAIVSTRSMDFEEIRRTPGAAMDIQRVMQALPAVVSGTDQNNEIIIRGGIPGENLFLMDDIEIPNPNHFGEQGTGGGPINMINTFMVRKVDFFAGAFPAKYGDRASSVMDIYLRDGSKETISGEFEIGMSGAGGIIEGYLPGMKTNYMFSARKSFLDLIISSTGLAAVPKYYNFQGRLATEINPKNKLIFNAVYGNDEINIENEGRGGYSRGAENVDYQGFQYAAGLTWKNYLSNQFYSTTSFSTIGNDWQIDVYRTRDQKTYFNNNSIEQEHTIKSDFVFLPADILELNFGASYKSTEFNHELWARADTIYEYTQDAMGNYLGDSLFFRLYPDYVDMTDASSFKSAIYGQLSWDIFKPVRLTMGLRHDYFEYNGFSSISPRLGMTYFFNTKTSLNFAYGKHFQSPAYLELTSHPKNKKLDNKFTEQYVLGFEKLIREDIKLTIETYYKNYKDVPVGRSTITRDPFDSFEGEMVNRGSGYAQGIEFFFQKKLIQNFSTILSYAYSVSKAKDVRSGDYYNWDYDFRNVFTFISGYKWRLQEKSWYQKMKTSSWFPFVDWLLPFGDEVEASLKFRYLGGRPYTPRVFRSDLKRWIIDGSQDFNTKRYPVYHRLDFRLDKRIFYKNYNTVFYFDLMNAYGRDNIWEYQYNDDGTTEEILQFEVFPVAGFLIEF